MWQAWEIDPDYRVRTEAASNRGRAGAATEKPSEKNRAARKKAESAGQKRMWLWEFSKKIVVLVAAAFFIALAYAFAFLLRHPDSAAINGVFTDITSVFKWTVVSYAVKAGFENVFKIKQSHEEKEE